MSNLKAFFFVFLFLVAGIVLGLLFGGTSGVTIFAYLVMISFIIVLIFKVLK